MRTMFDSRCPQMVQPSRRAGWPLRFATAVVAVAGLSSGGEARGPAAAAREVLASLNGQDVLVEAVGFRLATANADLCPHGWNAGFSVHSIEQYGADYRSAAAQMFQLGDHVGILSVVAASPAAAAGLRQGDAILAVDGQALPGSRPTGAAADFTRTGEAQRLIARAFEDGVAILSVMRTGAPNALQVRAVRACQSVFQVVPGRTMNAEADGFYVQVSSDLAALARTEGELAALLGHELAHNLLRHRSRLDRLGVDRGLLAPFGRNAHLIRQTESEADRLGIHLMASAGFAPADAVLFWERVRDATRTPFGDPTHPRWSQRLRAMKIEIARIAAGDSLPQDLARALRRP